MVFTYKMSEKYLWKSATLQVRVQIDDYLHLYLKCHTSSSSKYKPISSFAHK